MKRFRFSLERVRQWRETEIGIEHAKLEKALAELRRLVELRERLRRQLDEAGSAIQHDAAAGSRFDAGRFAELEEYRQFIRRKELEITVEESQCHQQVALQRERLSEARRRARVLERLRERALDQWSRSHTRELEETAAELYLVKLRSRRAGSRSVPGRT